MKKNRVSQCAAAGLALMLLSGCRVHHMEIDGGFTSYTKGSSIPIFGPDGAFGDNEPEFGVSLVGKRQDVFENVWRASVGEGTIVNSPQQKIQVVSLARYLRRTYPLAGRWSVSGQVGLRLAWVEGLGTHREFEAGPDLTTAISRSWHGFTVGFLGGFWWTPGGDFPKDSHPRFGIVFGWDF